MRMSELYEALTPSQYRPLVKGWNKERYADIFMDPKYKHDKKGYRVFIPLGVSELINKSKTQERVEIALETDGYEVVDYIKGLARNKKNGQQIKIGKVLTKFERTRLLNDYTKDEIREGVKDNYIVVISRHPYDIAGMSTDRGWSSCMNLDGGSNSHYVPLEIENGTVVAYCVKANDPDIKNPNARLLIKPFVNIENEKEIYLGIDAKVYGTAPEGFVNAVKKWVNWVNKTDQMSEVVFVKLMNGSYEDGKAWEIIGNLSPDERKVVERLRSDPASISQIENPSDALQLAAVSINPYAIKWMANPREKAQLLAVSKERAMIKHINNPSEKVQLAAVKGHGYAIEHIKDPSVAVQMAAITGEGNSGNNIEFIRHPAEEVQLAAVSHRGTSIQYIDNPSEKVQMAAVKQKLSAIHYIKNPTPAVVDYVKNNS